MTIITNGIRRIETRISGDDFPIFFEWCSEHIGSAMIYSGANEDGRDWIVRSSIQGDDETVYYLLRWGGTVL